jgi:hypothetical protein
MKDHRVVPGVGVEPTLLSELDFESSASANSATRAPCDRILRWFPGSAGKSWYGSGREERANPKTLSGKRIKSSLTFPKKTPGNIERDGADRVYLIALDV